MKKTPSRVSPKIASQLRPSSRLQKGFLPSLSALCAFALPMLVGTLGCDRGQTASAATLGTTSGAQVAGDDKPKIETPSYVVTVKENGPYKAGKLGTVEVTLTAPKGFHVNTEYPMAFKVTDVTDTVAYRAPKFEPFKEDPTYKNATKCTDTESGTDNFCSFHFPISFTPVKAGTVHINGTFLFGVCDKEHCLNPKETLGLDIKVGS